MNASILTALVVAVSVSTAGAGTIHLDLHFSDGSHEKTLLPSQTTWIELSFEVTGGALFAANIPWDITETHTNSFSVLGKELPAGWYDLLPGVPTPPFPPQSGGFHGFYTGESALTPPGLAAGVLERYLIQGGYGGEAEAVISVVDTNPLNPYQHLSLFGRFAEYLAVSPDGVRSIVLHTPEPVSLALLAFGGLVMLRRRLA